jgi:integrase/recombinase XerD
MKHLPLNNKKYEKYYQDFWQSIIVQGYGPKKKPHFPEHVREFLFFLENKGIQQIKAVVAIDIIAYYEYLKERPNQRKEGGLSDAMIRHHLGALRLFFDYLLDTGIIASSPAALPKFNLGKGKERSVATLEEIKEIYAVCETKRDRALLSIGYGCGLRRDEIVKLNVTDVLLHKGMLIVRDGKGGKHREIPISNAIVKDLKEYVVYERQTYFNHNERYTNPAFFVNGRGLRMTGNKLNDRLKYLVQLTENKTLIKKEITLHCLRHSIATHLIDNGANIEFVQHFLGHAGIDTSHLYAKRRKQRTNVLKNLG